MIQEYGNIWAVSFAVFSQVPSVAAAVSARVGGASGEPFASLNMSFSSGDDPAHVRHNRSLYLQALGLDPAQSVGCNQVHGTWICRVGKADCGRGALGRADAIPACDGLMTNEGGVALTMNFADCTPLLFCDPVHHAVAVSHGGWRGTAGNIGAVTLERMADAFGTAPADVLAAIGPAIGGCCFEVGQDVIDAFLPLFSAREMRELARATGKGKYHFDLPKANRFLLLRAGILPQHMEESHLCTYCRDDLFYSYRKASKAGQKTGRHMAVIAWKDGGDSHV